MPPAHTICIFGVDSVLWNTYLKNYVSSSTHGQAEGGHDFIDSAIARHRPVSQSPPYPPPQTQILLVSHFHFTKASMASYSANPRLLYTSAVSRLRSSARCQNSRLSLPGNGALSFWD